MSRITRAAEGEGVFPETFAQLVARAKRVDARMDSCGCPDEPHQNALHDLVSDVLHLAQETEKGETR